MIRPKQIQMDTFLFCRHFPLGSKLVPQSNLELVDVLQLLNLSLDQNQISESLLHDQALPLLAQEAQVDLVLRFYLVYLVYLGTLGYLEAQPVQ